MLRKEYKGKVEGEFKPLGVEEPFKYVIDYDKEITITLGTLQYMVDLVTSLKDRSGGFLNNQVDFVVQEMYAQIG